MAWLFNPEIWLALVGEGLEMHIPKGYIYFAMAFSLFVEILNMKTRLNRRVSIKQRGLIKR
jgi:predicted tellurium resistance membrane protein TerC